MPLRRLFRRRTARLSAGRRLAASGIGCAACADALDACLVEWRAVERGSQDAKKDEGPVWALSTASQCRPRRPSQRPAPSATCPNPGRGFARGSTATRSILAVPATPPASARCRRDGRRGAPEDARPSRRARPAPRERYALLVDEHRRADRQAGCPLGCIGSFANERPVMDRGAAGSAASAW